MPTGKFLRKWFAAPSPVPFWRQTLIALMCFAAILLTAFITAAFNQGRSPMLVASMGASAIIMLAIPGSSLAQPWAFVGGQLISAWVGIMAAVYVPDTLLALAVATGLMVWLMQLLRCLHPPAVATGLSLVLAPPQGALSGFGFMLYTVAVNVAVLLAAVVFINRYVLKHHYPLACHSGERSGQRRPGRRRH